VLRNASASSTGMNTPKVGNPMTFLRNPTMSAPMGTSRRMRNVSWKSSGRRNRDHWSRKRSERFTRS